MRTFKTYSEYSILVVITLMLSACSNENIITTTLAPDVTVTLDDSIYFQNSSIGKITSITRSDLGTQLEIAVNDDALLLLSSDAVAVENSFKANTPIEIHNGITNPGSLEVGSDIQGIPNMVQFGAWGLGNAVGVNGFSLNKYVKQFTEYVNGEEFNEQQRNINEAIQQSTELAKQTVTQLGNEVDKGVQQLQEMEDDLVIASEQIGAELGTTAKELEKSGEEIFQEFEKLINKLTEQSEVNSDSETAGINILLALLQGLNGSLEENEASNANGGAAVHPETDPDSPANETTVEP
ncbi:MAG TPA: hypothetical protein DCY55_08710 [Gammaproteobacteria bacterium]|nr:hypothetical protein [Gammaproteobacteria bacterium]